MLQLLKNWIYRLKPYRAKFQAYYQGTGWECPESKSGPGSTLEATKAIREALPGIFRKYGIKSAVDIPCGDFNWMKQVNLDGIDYRGLDIVGQLVAENTERYGRANIRFDVWDVMKTTPPPGDLLICRDCLFHYTTPLAMKGLRNLMAANARYLLTTTFPPVVGNRELFATGWFRPINLQLPPFNLPPPLELIMEEPERGKALGLWKVGEIRAEGGERRAVGSEQKTVGRGRRGKAEEREEERREAR